MSEEPKYPERLTLDDIQDRLSLIKRLAIVSAVFAVTGYLLVLLSLYLELTQLHPLIDQFAHQYPDFSLFGGGKPRTGLTQLNNDLAQMQKLGPLGQRLLWLKLGGIGHILVGIFISLVTIIRVLSLMPHRVGYEMERAQQ